MPIASRIETPSKPAEVKQPWTIKRMFPFSGAVSTMIKSYNPFEIFSAFALFITGIGELIGREFSWCWYLILLINLVGAFSIHYLGKLCQTKLEKT